MCQGVPVTQTNDANGEKWEDGLKPSTDGVHG